MLPAATAPLLTRPHLPIPPIIRRPTEQNFYRYRKYIQDFPSPSPIVTEAYRSQTIRNDPEPSRNLDYEQENTQQNKQRLCQQEENRFKNNNQEGNNHQGQPPQQQRRTSNEEGIMGGSRSYQPNGSIINTRMASDPLTPATDVYSFLNRLSELFPDIHPTQLQRVFDDCGRDFLRTIDNVLYARRFRKSVIAHMSKYRSFNRSQVQKSIILNSQQQKERNPEGFTKNTQSETRTRNSPKTRRLTTPASGQQSKRSRVFAFKTPKTQRNSMKGEEQINPRTSQSVSSYPSTPLTHFNKKPTPPPNVFLHPVDNNQQTGGNTNTRYMISLKRPHTLHYGAPPTTSSNLTVPLVLDNSIFQSSLPLPSVRYPLLEGSVPRSSCFGSPCSVDQEILQSAQEKQQQQPPHQQLEQIQVQPTQQEMEKEHEMQKEAEQMAGASTSQAMELPYSSEPFEIDKQANEEDPWSNFIKSFCEPLHSEETEGNGLMIQLLPNSQNEDNRPNETSSECGSYLYRSMPQVVSDEDDQSGQQDANAKDLNTSGGSESRKQETDGEKKDSPSARDVVQRDDTSTLVIRTQRGRKRKSTSLNYQSVTADEKESMDDVPIEEGCEVVGQSNNLEELIMGAKEWTENEEEPGERENDLEIDQSDEEYMPGQ